MNVQSRVIRVGPWRRIAQVVRSIGLTLMLLTLSVTTARAEEPVVVGDGTPESCTLEALHQAVAAVPAGGTITFNCGPEPVTIWIADVELYKDMKIDGGGQIIFTGGTGSGGAFFVSGAAVEFSNFIVTDAYAADSGPILNEGTLTLRNVTVSHSTADRGFGGGGIVNRGTMTIEDSAIINNGTGCMWDSCGDGGGIANYGILHIVNSTISGNTTRGSGGGIYNGATATIENSTISGNSSGCQYDGAGGILFCLPGGGIYNAGTMSILNSTISGNSTGNAVENLTSMDDSGGGIANEGTLFLQNTTIAVNIASSGGGLANTGTATLQNSLLAGNTSADQQPSDCAGTLTSQSHNLIGTTTGCAIDGDTSSDLYNVDPMLGPLQDNGGPTLTHLLLPGSPTIDAGNPAAPGSGGTACEATDQRGVTRPLDGDGDGLARCDIGALEVQQDLLVTIDIKPGNPKNPIELQSQGVIPVAVLSTATFDAATLDVTSVRFGRGEALAVKNSLKDVNGDGRRDLLLHFRTQDTGIRSGDTQACLTGQTQSRALIHGCDTIHVLLGSIPPGLVLWNKLGSEDEVLHSEIGPDLGFYRAGDCQNAGCIPSVEVKGNPAYIPGVYGNALTLDPGPYFSLARVFNAVLRNSDEVLDGEQGAVEMWFQETANPLPWTYGIYRLFNGSYGLGDGIGVWVQTPDQYNPGQARLMFTMNGLCNVESQSDGQLGYDISSYNNTWIHVAVAWDRNGIAGTSKTMELFVDGLPVASTTCSDWSFASTGTIDIGGGNDDQIAGKFAVDNLKVWNYAKTNYSDRFIEGFKKTKK